MLLFKTKNILLFSYFLLSLLYIKCAAQEEIEPIIQSIIVPIADIHIPDQSLLLTSERISQVKDKILEDPTAWNALTSKISHYFEKIPYNAGEYAAAFALAYYVSGDEKYINRAIVLLNHEYFSTPETGWEYYNSRNIFRTNARWALMGYSWIKEFISLDEQERIEDIFKLWSDYWLIHVDSENNFKALRVEDTDDVTSVTKNLTLLGYVLSSSEKHQQFGQMVLTTADTLLERYIVNYYMQDIMKGGAWAEGSDYSPATQVHWIETFLLNKEQRGINYPTNYARLAMNSLIHQTLASHSGVYKYGSEERAEDYDSLEGDYRYELALSLMAILEDPNDVMLINKWFDKIISKEGFKSGSMVTHFDRLLFHNPHLINSSADEISQDTMHFSQGIGLVASRDSWQDDATNLYFLNRKIRVDHEHKDALSFDVAYQGKWITKEATGYGGASESSRAHNTILIENAADGSSSPTRRPAGDPYYHALFNDDYVTLISADATQTYNMSGYFATEYAKQVNRQIAFIKPSTVIIYDHVITDKTATRDLVHYQSSLNLSSGMDHIRWVKLIQHVQAKPSIIEEFTNSFAVFNDNVKLAYQVHWPKDAEVSIIDEKVYWQDSLEYEMPENQRKWHFQVTNNNVTEDNEFITSLNFGSNVLEEQFAISPFVMTKENGYILKGNIKGLAVNINSNKYIILFNRSPLIPITEVEYNKPPGFENAKIYGVGIEIENL